MSAEASLQPLSPVYLLIAPFGSLQPVAAAFDRMLLNISWLPPIGAQFLLVAPVLALLILATLPDGWLSAHVRFAHRLILRLDTLLQRDWIFHLLVGIFILAMRFPLLAYPYEFNVDESTFIAAAAKLLHFPMSYYQVVDTGTSGPVNIYPLLLPALFGFQLDYAAARLVGILLVWGVCVFLYRTLRILAPRPLARFAVLPMAGWFASITYHEFVHYSSEHVPLFLISIALWLCVSLFRSEADGAWFAPVALGIVCALLVLAKFQTIPMVAAIIASACFGMLFPKSAISRRQMIRGPAMLLTSMAAFLVLTYAALLILGTAEDFRQYYIVRNLAYAQTAQSIYLRLRGIWSLLTNLPNIFYFYAGVLAFLVLELGRRLKGPSQKPAVPVPSPRKPAKYPAKPANPAAPLAAPSQPGLRRALLPFGLFGIVAIALTLGASRISDTVLEYALLGLVAALVWAAVVLSPLLSTLDFRGLNVKLAILVVLFWLSSVYAVTAPGRGYHHYLLFLVTPLFWSAAVALLSDSPRVADRNPWTRRPYQLFFLLLFAIPFINNVSIDRARFLDTTAGRLPEAARAVLAFGHPGEYLDVWGWRSNLYVKTQMIQAAQHSDSLPELEDGPYRDYSRKRYIEEFDRTNPPVFADEVGGTSFGYRNRAKFAHEQFPELAKIIASRYTYMSEADTVRIFLRNDRIPVPVLPAAAGDICDYHVAAPKPCSTTVPRTFVLEAVVLPFRDQVAWANILGNTTDPPSGGFALQRSGLSDQFSVGLETTSGGPVLSPEFSLAPFKPHYIAVAVQEKELAVEVDGVRVATIPITRDLVLGALPPVIGKGVSGGREFHGVIFEARISRASDSFNQRKQTWQRIRAAYGIPEATAQ